MHTNILSSKQQELLPLIKQFSDDFGLVGRTAIALYLGHRAKWKDYVDLYFLFHRFDLNELCKKAIKLFGTQFNEKLFRVQLGYFTDIDYTEEVEFMEGVEISQKEIHEYLKNISLKE